MVTLMTAASVQRGVRGRLNVLRKWELSNVFGKFIFKLGKKGKGG